MTEQLAASKQNLANRLLALRRRWDFKPLLFALSLVALITWRPLVNGVTIQATFSFWLFIIFYSIVPGVLFYRALNSDRDDWLILLGMGWALGHGLQLLVYVGLKVAGLSSLFVLYPLAIPVLAVWMVSQTRHDSRTTRPASPPAHHLLILLTLAALVMELPRLVSTPAALVQGVSLDRLFHAGNAGELLHRWPLQDPRVAGLAMNYHFFAYAFPAGASQVTGIPASQMMLSLEPTVGAALLLIQVYNAGRIIFRDHLAGLAAAAVVLFPTDIGRELGFGHFNSFLQASLIHSLTTLSGLMFLVTLAIVLHRWLTTDDRQSFRDAVLLGMLGFVTSGVKSSVMPMVILALAGVVVWRFVFQRRIVYRVLTASVILGLASIPMSLILSLGDNTYSTMLRLRPGQVVYESGFYRQVVEAIGHNSALDSVPFWLDVPITLVWLVGYLGLAGISGLLYFLRNRRELNDTALWSLLLLLSGLVPAYLIGAPGYSQLFFLYNGQIMLGILGGATIVSLLRSPSRNAALLVLLAVLAAPVLLRITRVVGSGLRNDLSGEHTSVDPLVSEYYDGMLWLRNNTPPDAVILANHSSMVVSAFGERRAYYETGEFTPKMHALSWQGIEEPYPERVATRTQFFATPDQSIIQELMHEYGAVHVLLDNTQVIQEHGDYRLVIDSLEETNVAFPDDFGSPVYANSAMQIYQLDEIGQ